MNKINIGGKVYRLKYVEGDEINYNTANVNTAYQIIKINKEYPKEKQEEGLLHEIFEALDSEHDLKLSHQTICTLSACVYDTLVRNKIKW